MPRRIFFSFHHARDAQRAQVVRNSPMLKRLEEEPWVNAAAWEAVKLAGDAAIKRWINARLDRSSVVVVLIGAETASRRYVRYEIARAHTMGRGLLGINVNAVPSFAGTTHPKGPNPFKLFVDERTGQSLADIYPVYGWKANDGYHNLAAWVEQAARNAGFR